jgi:hypothetical protein
MPLLGAGTHSLTAIFRPAAGSGLGGSQTSVPFQLTVTAAALTAESATVEVGGDESSPYLELRTTGPFVDTWGTPAGTWSVSVERDGEKVLSDEVSQTAGSESELVALGALTRPGSTLLVTTEFVPDAAVASGLELTQPKKVTLEIPALSPVEFLTSSAQLPWWLVAVLTALVLGAVAWLLVVLVRRPRVPAGAEPSPVP